MTQGQDESTGKLLLSYYGDDFTGSTDCLEVLALNGLKAVLFFEIPDRALLETEFRDVQCIGLAGVSRAMKRSEMTEQLPQFLQFLNELPSHIVHYKVCSTFDSSPEIGSIGLAIDLARDVFPKQNVIPLVVGAPALKRYTVFGNHFASVGNETFRLDRHPTMSKHPTTPMHESDLRLILLEQSALPVMNMDVLSLHGEVHQVQQKFKMLVDAAPPAVVLFDVLDDERLKKTGQLIWEYALSGNRFVVGSSGIEYALTAHWKDNGDIPTREFQSYNAAAESQILVLSGSCSPVTEKQISYAINAGFVGIQIPPDMLFAQQDTRSTMRDGIIQRAMSALRQGKSVILYSALGPEDSSIEEVKFRSSSAGLPSFRSAEVIGKELGGLGMALMQQTGIRRVVVAGGDTSGHVARELHIDAVSLLSPIEPGGPLCQVYSSDASMNGTQIALKGGQVGSEDYFLRVRDGRSYVP